MARTEWHQWKKPHVILATEVVKGSALERVTKFRISRPNQCGT